MKIFAIFANAVKKRKSCKFDPSVFQLRIKTHHNRRARKQRIMHKETDLG